MTGCTEVSIEEAIINKLKPLTVEAGGEVKTLRIYGGEFSDPATIRPWARSGFPAILVSIKGGNYADIGYPAIKDNLIIEIYCCTQSLRDNSSDHARIGSYSVMRTVLSALHDADLGISVTPPKVLNWGNLEIAEGISVLRISFTMGNILRP